MRINILKNPITFAFLIPFTYWIYLFFNANMGITMDAATYESLASRIHSEGWTAYFSSGPNKEPLYPFLISLSMHIADQLSVSYQKIQTIFQIICLFISQLLMFRLLKKANIHRCIISFIILYMGLSPTLINSTFSLFSEVLAYPLILGIVLVSSKAWNLFQKCSFQKMLSTGLCLGILFVLIVSTKSAFLYIFSIYLIPFIILLLISFVRKNFRQSVNILLFILIASLSLTSYVKFMKAMNQKHNGSYVVSYQAGFMLYGSTTRRVKKLTPKQILTAFAMAPGKGVCHMIFGQENCNFWSFQASDNLGAKKRNALANAGLTSIETNKQLMHLSKKEILSNPIQYSILYVAESLKMFFWESTKIGFVSYPSWLSTLFFDLTFFNLALRLCTALLSLISFVYLIWFLIQNKNTVFGSKLKNSEAVTIYFFTLLILACFAGIYSLLCILTRYTFPIIPLHLLNIGLFLQKLSEKLGKDSEENTV